MKIPKQIFNDVYTLGLDELRKIVIIILGKLFRLLGTNGLIGYWETIKNELGIK